MHLPRQIIKLETAALEAYALLCYGGRNKENFYPMIELWKKMSMSLIYCYKVGQ